MTNEQHLAAYMAGIQEAWESAQQIQAHVSNNCGVSPDDVHAGHVGNIRHVCAELNSLKTFLGIQEE